MSSHNLIEPTFARTRLGSGPGLLLAHGAGSSLAGTYGPVLEALAARHTVVGIDYPAAATPLAPPPRCPSTTSPTSSSPPPTRRASTASPCPASPSAARSPSEPPPATPSASPHSS